MKIKNTKIIKNDKVIISFYEKREDQRAYIIARDLTDGYNESTLYTRKIRGIEMAWKFIEQIFNSYELKEDLDFNDIYKILEEKFNLDVHTYCAID